MMAFASAAGGHARSTDPTEPARLRFVLVCMALVLGANVLGALTAAGPRFALASTFFTVVVMVGGTLWRRDAVLARWLVIGFVAGWIEIATDAWLVGHTGTLVYPPGEPMVWDSPLYMPFAWMLVLAQLGAIGGVLLNRWGILRATAATALLGGVSIPLYEHLAKGAGYWWYQDTPMLFSAPLYVILSEALIALPLVWVHRHAVSRPGSHSLGLGLAVGLWMLPCVGIAWVLVGPCMGAWLPVHCG
ncbi:MAG: DUF6989 domain-containing protein [Rubrivivax sp.]|jgi:hypothetical protein